MNYIEQINGFWAKAETEDLDSSSIALYFAILKYCNKLNWLNPFICDWEIMSQYAGMSKNTYYKCVKILHAKGYINYQEGIKNKIKSKIEVYSLTGNNKGKIKEQPCEQLYEQHQEQTCEQPCEVYINNKLINNRTIKLINENASLVNEKIEFWIKSEKEKNEITEYLDLPESVVLHIKNQDETEKEKSCAKKEKLSYKEFGEVESELHTFFAQIWDAEEETKSLGVWRKINQFLYRLYEIDYDSDIGNLSLFRSRLEFYSKYLDNVGRKYRMNLDTFIGSQTVDYGDGRWWENWESQYENSQFIKSDKKPPEQKKKKGKTEQAIESISKAAQEIMNELNQGNNYE